MAISSINKSVGKIMNNTVTKTFAKSLEKGQLDPAKYAAQMLVISLVSKDAVNCVFYTVQSYNNKRIPEDKRKFVASLDLMNGIINVAGQLVAWKLIERALTPKLIGKFTGLIKDKDTGKYSPHKSTAVLHNDNIRDLAKQSINEIAGDIKSVDTKKTEAILQNAVKKYGKGGAKFGAIETGLTIIVTSLATTALVKRTLTPLFATPLAGWFKRKYMEKPSKDGKPKEEIVLTPKEKADSLGKIAETKPTESSKKPVDVKV